MFRTKTKAEVAQEKAADLSAAASERYQAAKEAARETAGPALADAAEAAKLKLAAAREAATPVMHDVADRAKPRIEAAQSTLIDDLLPKLGAVLAAAAASLAEAGEHAKDAAAPRMELAREEAHVYNDRAKDALRVFRGEAIAVAPKRSKAPLLIGVGLAAAAVAAVAAFRKKQQADDPWATPLTDSMASTQPSFKAKVEQAREVVADTAQKAKEKGSELAESAKDKASDLAAKGQAAVADAKDRSGEDSSLAAAFEEDLGGQVTSVEPTPGADALEGREETTGISGSAATDKTPRTGPPTRKSTAAKPRGEQA